MSPALPLAAIPRLSNPKLLPDELDGITEPFIADTFTVQVGNPAIVVVGFWPRQLLPGSDHRSQWKRIVCQYGVHSHLSRMFPVGRHVATDGGSGNEDSLFSLVDGLYLLFGR